jgi:signal transduction histidine kinase
MDWPLRSGSAPLGSAPAELRVAATAVPAPAASPEDGIDLEAPLPAELTGSHPSWFNRYRFYPVFSRAWALGRTKVWGAWLLGLAVVLIVAQVLPLAQDGGHPVVAAAGVALVVAFGAGVPLLLGPWLAWQVRRRGWPRRRELAALAGAFVLTVGVTMLLFHHVRPALKNAVSQWVEGTDAGTTVVMLNLLVQRQPPASAGAPSATSGMVEEAPWGALTRYTLGTLLILWLAGGMGLPGLQRERRALVDMRRRRELQAALQARREAELRLSVLQAQVEPHFLFNTLAGVRSAVTGDPARAVEIVDRLVEYLRASIPRLRSGASEAEATLGAQLDVARAYLSLMHSRLLRLSFAVQVDDDLLPVRCPPLLLISLVENAVKHGIEPKVGPGRIEVAARRVPAPDGTARLEISVSDDGVGLREGAMGGGLGLVNVRERLQQLYGAAGELRLQSRPGGGACATLSLPLEHPA